MTGNVWEWCADWFDPGYYARSPRVAPTGPPQGTSRVMRGGSYLCHESYCWRYRVDSRSSNTPDSTTGNLGFRVAYDGTGARGLGGRIPARLRDTQVAEPWRAMDTDSSPRGGRRPTAGWPAHDGDMVKR